MSVEQTMRQILEAESQAIREIPYTPAFDKAVQLIVDRVHRKGASSSRPVWVKPDKSR